MFASCRQLQDVERQAGAMSCLPETAHREEDANRKSCRNRGRSYKQALACDTIPAGRVQAVSVGRFACSSRGVADIN